MRQICMRGLALVLLTVTFVLGGCQTGKKAHPEMLTGQSEQVEHERHSKGIASHSAD